MTFNRIGNNGFGSVFKTEQNKNWDIAEASINQLNAPGNITSEKIAANAITPFDLINEDTINLFNRLRASSGVILLNDGTIASKTDGYISEFIPVKEGEIYSVTTSYSSQGGYFNSSYNWVQPVAPAVSQQTGGYKITVPSGVSYMRLNTLEPKNFMIIRGNKYPNKYFAYKEKIPLNWIETKIDRLPNQVVSMESMINDGNTVNLFDKSTLTFNKYVDNNGVISDSSIIHLSDYIPVIGGNSYTVTTGYSTQGAMYDSDNNWIGALPHPSSTTNVPFTFTLPKNVNYVRLNVVGGIVSSFMLVPGIMYPDSYSPYGVRIPWLLAPKSQITSKWSNKKWGADGDSLTEENFRTNKNYHGYIADKINCIVTNYGVSGTGWRTSNSAGTGRPIHERIGAMDPTLDLITVFAGINDWIQTGMPLVIGEFGDTDPAVSLYGAIDNTLKQLITKYPTKTIAVFTPLPSGDSFNGPNSSGIYLEQVVDAIIKVANKYSIPVLDLYRKSSLFPWNDTANDYYFKAVGQSSGDRLHLNDAGHQRLADIILAFLNTL